MDIFTKILRWAFVQTFGSKTKTYFDTVIAPQISKAATTLTADKGKVTTQDILSAFGANTNTFSNILNGLMTTLKVPAMYRGVAATLLAGYVEAFVKGLKL